MHQPLTPPGRRAIVNGLSVDVEDWFQVGAFENVIARGEWDSIKTRVEDNVYRVQVDVEYAEVEGQAAFISYVFGLNVAGVIVMPPTPTPRGSQSCQSPRDRQRRHRAAKRQLRRDR